MPAQIDVRDEALRRAREAALVVLAKHTCLTGGSGAGCAETRPGPSDLRLDCDRVLARYERQDVGRDQPAAVAGGPLRSCRLSA